jgi:hypothetical protein
MNFMVSVTKPHIIMTKLAAEGTAPEIDGAAIAAFKRVRLRFFRVKQQMLPLDFAILGRDPRVCGPCIENASLPLGRL